MSEQVKTLKTLRAAMPEISAKYLIKSLAIFGSLSRMDDNENSDIDLLVESNRSVRKEFIHLCYELEEILNRKVDLVTRNGIIEKYFKEIEPEVIYV